MAIEAVPPNEHVWLSTAALGRPAAMTSKGMPRMLSIGEKDAAKALLVLLRATHRGEGGA
jgi:hypothetical protein